MDDVVKEKIDTFFDSSPVRTFAKKQLILYAGDDPKGIYYLVEGEIRKYDINNKGDEVVVNVFAPPSFFPISWLLNGTPNQYFYESFTDVSLRVASAEDTLHFLMSNPDVMLDLLSRLYRGVDGMQRRMAYLMGGSAKSRVLFELILECKRFGKQRSDGTYVLAMHENELASRSGLARETISRHLAKLNHGTLVKVNHKQIVVRDLNALEKMLGDTISR